jgi:phage regulator Rha-like protein
MISNIHLNIYINSNNTRKIPSLRNTLNRIKILVSPTGKKVMSFKVKWCVGKKSHAS